MLFQTILSNIGASSAQEDIRQQPWAAMLLKNVLEETDFKFSYLIDAQSMLYPPMMSVKILAKLINATNIDRLDIPVG